MNAPFDMQEMLQDFLTEAKELLDDVDARLIELERHPDDENLLNTVFRGFHTIKGGAGFLDATALVEICHRAEGLLDQLRSGKRRLSPKLLDVILAATAAIHEIFEQLSTTGVARAADPSLIQALETALGGSADSVEASAVRPSAHEDGIDWAGLLSSLTEEASPPAEAPAEPKAAPPPRAPTSSEAVETTLRVDTARFDQILNLTGEIGLVKNRLTCLRTDILEGARRDDAAYEGTLNDFDNVVGQLESLVGSLQHSVMKARMQPVGRVFQKYARVARDLGRQLGKDVELALSGGETEIDKMMIDELNDPLVHLIRNAVDHGVDTPEERAAAGKPAKSTIELSAHQSGDHIIIEIADDGRGMRPEVIRRKAVEKGLIAAEEVGGLDDRQSLNLIFLPGFSTKDEISSVSGRGVGMDIVGTKITNLNGRVDIHSEPGKGTRVTIVLPLTMAILPVLMFTVGEQQYGIPLSMVREILPLDHDKLQTVSGRPHMVVRGEVLPILGLDILISPSSDAPRPPSEVGIVVTRAHQVFILAVDSFFGRDEVTMKPLDGFKPKGIAGATLSREGRLVLILDLNELLDPRLAQAA